MMHSFVKPETARRPTNLLRVSQSNTVTIAGERLRPGSRVLKPVDHPCKSVRHPGRALEDIRDVKQRRPFRSIDGRVVRQKTLADSLDQIAAIAGNGGQQVDGLASFFQRINDGEQDEVETFGELRNQLPQASVPR